MANIGLPRGTTKDRLTCSDDFTGKITPPDQNATDFKAMRQAHAFNSEAPGDFMMLLYEWKTLGTSKAGLYKYVVLLLLKIL